MRSWLACCLMLAGCDLALGLETRTPDAPPDAPPRPLPASCAALPEAPSATHVMVTDVAQLRTAVGLAVPNTIISLAQGTYALAGVPLDVLTSYVTLRSATGLASDVVLDGGNTGTHLVGIKTSNVTLSRLTLANARGTAVLVQPGSSAILGTLVHAVSFLDNGGPAIDISSSGPNPEFGPYADNGTVVCSKFVSTQKVGVDHCARGAIGIMGRAIRGWRIADNLFQDLRCATQPERVIWIRAGSRDTQIINNTFIGSPMNIMLGNDPSQRRMYMDGLPPGCSGAPDHWGGVICNNRINGVGVNPHVGADFDEGIALWNACDPLVIHNTVVTPSGGEAMFPVAYRYPGTFVRLVNNLADRAPLPRDGARQDTTFAASNATYMSTADFVAATRGGETDLHLTPAAVVPAGASIAGLGCDLDADGNERSSDAPTPGAYERQP